MRQDLFLFRREAKIREQNERIARAQQQKEAELRERIRQRQEKELLKQKAVLDRRCHQLEKDKSKMQVCERNFSIVFCVGSPFHSFVWKTIRV